MFLRTAHVFFAVALSLSFYGEAQSSAETLHYAGTVGQQHVAMQIELLDDAVNSGHYAYDRQGEIQIVDSRIFGTTVVLQDEDGNILHLHFESAGGAKAGGWKYATMLEGTLARGDLDLPVRLTREAR